MTHQLSDEQKVFRIYFCFKDSSYGLHVADNSKFASYEEAEEYMLRLMRSTLNTVYARMQDKDETQTLDGEEDMLTRAAYWLDSIGGYAWIEKYLPKYLVVKKFDFCELLSAPR